MNFRTSQEASRRRGFLRLGLAGVCAVNLLAAEPEPPTPVPSGRPVTLEGCLQRALRNNRALQIERINPIIAQGLLGAGQSAYDPVFYAEARLEESTDSGGLDPADFSRDAIYEADSEVARLGLTGLLPSGLSYSVNGSYAQSEGTRNFMDFESYNLYAGFTVRQPLLRNSWIDQPRLSIRVARHNLRITELGVVYLTLDIVNQVRQAYFELLFAVEDRGLHEQLVSAREALVAGTRRQVEAGLLTQPELSLAESQRALARTTLLQAQLTVAAADNALRALMGEAFTNDLERPLLPAGPLEVGVEDFNLQASWRHGLDHRPDLQQLRHDLQKADLDLKYRQNQLFPSLDLVAGYSRRGASTIQAFPPIQPRASASDAIHQIGVGDNPSDFVGVIFSLPLGRVAERHQRAISRQLRQQAELMLKQQEEMVQRQIQDAYQGARSAFDRVAAAQGASTAAEAVVAAEAKRLEAGQSTLLAVLLLQREWINAASIVVRAKADYNQRLSHWWFADASLLRRTGIEVQFE